MTMIDRCLTLEQCASMVEGEMHGDGGLLIKGVGDLTHASGGDLSFITKPQMLAGIEHSRAAAFIVPKGLGDIGRPYVTVDDPVLAITRLHLHFTEKPFTAGGIDGTCRIGANCCLPEQVNIGPLLLLR